MSASTIDFWFDLASLYSALAALRIADVAQGLEVRWHPFQLDAPGGGGWCTRRRLR